MKNLSFKLFAVIVLFISACNSQEKEKQKETVVVTSKPTIEVIQFHSEHRCITCMKIEKLTKATLAKSYATIPFKLYNVDDTANAKIAEQFEATGTALYLYNPKTGKKQDLTDFAFMKAGNETDFDVELKKSIVEFLNN